MDVRSPVLGLTFDGPEPVNWRSRYPDIVVTTWSDGTFYIAVDLESPDCDRLLDSLEKDCRIPSMYSCHVYPGKDWWKDSDERWVGATFLTDNFVRVSPNNHFDPSCPSPCLGIIPPHVPLHILDQPRGDVVGVRHEDLFSVRMADYLASRASCQFGEVTRNNTILQSHRRIFPQLTSKVIPAEVLKTVHCAACDSSIVKGLGGVKLGHRVNEFTLCRNMEGMGHLAAEHPIIVSITLANELSNRFCSRSYAFEPILAIDSTLGQRILHVSHRLEHFLS